MKIKLLVLAGTILTLAFRPAARADVLEMQNGDRYSGKVLSLSANVVVLDSEMLGKINVPRKKVLRLTFGSNAVPGTAGSPMPVPIPTNLSAGTAASILANTNADLSTTLRQLGANTNFVGQIRQQMLAGSPEASAKYDEIMNGLLTGQLNLKDIRRQAQSSADQLRELKRELGPEAGDTLDGYLQILDSFLKETAASQ
jgi:hypothetical protein